MSRHRFEQYSSQTRGSLLAWGLGVLACGAPAPEERFAVARADVRSGQVSEARLESFGSCGELLGGLQAELVRKVHERAELLGVPPSTGAEASLFGDAVAARREPSALGFSSHASRLPGVHESDGLQTEGDRIYLLGLQALHVLAAWPPSEATRIASVPVEGTPTGLQAHAGTVAVFSHIFGALPGAPEEQYPEYYNPVFTKLTLVDTTALPPRVLRELYFEGQSFSSFREGSVVRAVLQRPFEVQLDEPVISYVDSFGRPRSQAQIDRQVSTWVRIQRSSIEGSALDDYVGSAFERVGEVLAPLPAPCSEFYLSANGTLDLGATSVLSVDLGAPAELGESLVLVGSDGAVFIGPGSAVVRQHYHPDGPADPARLASELHLFRLEGVQAHHEASGSVSGYLPDNLFFDERGGVIRAAPSDELGTRFVTLAANGGQLHELGRSEPVEGNSPLSALTFAGNRVYGITGSLVIPGELVVADLSEPRAPALAGRLALDGVTNVLVPRPGGRLLAALQVGPPSEASVALQLFDARDAAAPVLEAEYRYGEASSSIAGYDSHAIGFHPAEDLFVFPLTRTYGESSLEIFRLSSPEGFTRLGGIAAEPSAPLLPRGLLRENAAFAFSSSSVVAFDLGALAGPPLVEVELPGP